MTRGGLAATALLAVACGGAPPHEPGSPSHLEPTQKTAAPLPASGEIYAVDWPAERRADLEIAMHAHVAVLAQDGGSVRVLADCTVPGPGYEAKPEPVKEDVVRLETFAEVRSSLVYAATQTRIETEMSKGAVVEIAVAVAGTTTTSRESVRRSELSGDCKGATHFVKGASTGAFGR